MFIMLEMLEWSRTNDVKLACRLNPEAVNDFLMVKHRSVIDKRTVNNNMLLRTPKTLSFMVSVITDSQQIPLISEWFHSETTGGDDC